MHLNEIINKRVGFGRYQITSFFFLCLIDMSDGVEIILTSFLNPIIKAIFPDVSTSFVSSLVSIFYIGSFFGSLISGQLADQYGRRYIIRIGAVLQIIVSVLFYFADSLFMMFLLRLLYGFSFGFTIAVTTSILAEINPEAYRGKGVLLLNFFISFGKMYGVILGYYFLEQNLALTNWKLMLVCGALPNIFVLFGSTYLMKESPRFLLSQHRFQEGIQVINTMIATNKGELQPLLSQNQKQSIIHQFQGNQISEDQFRISVLFTKQNRGTTIPLGLCWIIIAFCFYGQLTIEALHISGPKLSLRQGLNKYFFTIFGQLPSLLLTLLVIDHPFFGRKNTLVLSFIVAGLLHSIFAFSQMLAAGLAARFFMKNVYQVLYPLTTESFPTKIRTKGFGFCSAIGRVGSILMGFILVPLDTWNRASVYILLSLIGLWAGYIVWMYIKQTLNKNIDYEEKKDVLLAEINPS